MSRYWINNHEGWKKVFGNNKTHLLLFIKITEKVVARPQSFYFKGVSVILPNYSVVLNVHELERETGVPRTTIRDFIKVHLEKRGRVVLKSFKSRGLAMTFKNSDVFFISDNYTAKNSINNTHPAQVDESSHEPKKPNDDINHIPDSVDSPSKLRPNSAQTNFLRPIRNTKETTYLTFRDKNSTQRKVSERRPKNGVLFNTSSNIQTFNQDDALCKNLITSEESTVGVGMPSAMGLKSGSRIFEPTVTVEFWEKKYPGSNSYLIRSKILNAFGTGMSAELKNSTTPDYKKIHALCEIKTDNELAKARRMTDVWRCYWYLKENKKLPGRIENVFKIPAYLSVESAFSETLDVVNKLKSRIDYESDREKNKIQEQKIADEKKSLDETQYSIAAADFFEAFPDESTAARAFELIFKISGTPPSIFNSIEARAAMERSAILTWSEKLSSADLNGLEESLERLKPEYTHEDSPFQAFSDLPRGEATPSSKVSSKSNLALMSEIVGICLGNAIPKGSG